MTLLAVSNTGVSSNLTKKDCNNTLQGYDVKVNLLSGPGLSRFNFKMAQSSFPLMFSLNSANLFHLGKTPMDPEST